MRTTLYTVTLALLLAGSPVFAGDAAAPAPPPAPEPAATTPAMTPAFPAGACRPSTPPFMLATEGDDLTPILGPVCECFSNDDCRVNPNCPNGICWDADVCGRCRC